MNEQQRAELKTMLLGRKRDIEDVIAANEEYILTQLNVEEQSDTSKAPTHPADAPVMTSEQDKEFNLINMERNELSSINESLERIDAGEYGRCDHCGIDIPFERLKAIPFTRHCVDCQEELELARERADRLRPAQ